MREKATLVSLTRHMTCVSLLIVCRLFSRGVIFMHARISLALLFLRKNGGLPIVYCKSVSLCKLVSMLRCQFYQGKNILLGYYCVFKDYKGFHMDKISCRMCYIYCM